MTACSQRHRAPSHPVSPATAEHLDCHVHNAIAQCHHVTYTRVFTRSQGGFGAPSDGDVDNFTSFPSLFGMPPPFLGLSLSSPLLSNIKSHANQSIY